MASPDAYTAPFVLTKSMHRDVYPAIDPTNEKLNAASKVIMVFGATSGLGFLSHIYFTNTEHTNPAFFTGRSQVMERRQSRSHCPRWPGPGKTAEGRERLGNRIQDTDHRRRRDFCC
jgi:hypothetical protein